MSKKKKKRSNIPFIIIFIIGIGVFLYPKISDLYYRVSASQEISDFDAEKNKLNEDEIKERIKLAKAFNDTLNNSIVGDPYSEETRARGKAEYARMLELHEKIGHVVIPKIEQDIPVYAGTAEEVLQKGAGHLEGTSLPVGGNSTHTIITAHTGLPKAKLFTDLTKMEVGDKFYIHNLGETLAYQVDQIKVIEPSDFSDLLIVEGHDYATLLTCTPIMINSHRLIVRGHRVEYVPEIEARDTKAVMISNLYRNIFYASIALIFIFIILILILRSKIKKLDKRLNLISQQISEASESIQEEIKEEKQDEK